MPVFVETRRRELDVPPGAAFVPIRRIGGDVGWYAFDRLWRFRAWLDRLAGGEGGRRGRCRRDPEALRVGDPVDGWRVESYEPGRLLRLVAEMKLPGRARLEYEVIPRPAGCVVRQTSTFDPDGLAGRLYWYAVLPLHALVFRRMLDGLVREARRVERRDGDSPQSPSARRRSSRNAEGERA